MASSAPADAGAPPAAPAAAAPAAAPVPPGYAARTEGLATILQKGNEVFYNPVQVVNRDLSVAVLTYFAKVRASENAQLAGKRNPRFHPSGNGPPRDRSAGLHILEGLAASGLRAIRYAREIDGVARVVANDLDPAVVDALRRNVEHNGPEVVAKVVPSVGDARLVMMNNPSSFDAVDLDPYGSPSQLLDAAVQAADEGGLLLITATDMATLCGNNSEACFAKYGCYPLHKPYCHEGALRMLLACLHVTAARYKRYIVPVLSCSIDFYIRVFVRIYTSAAEVKNSATKLGYLYQSQQCDSFHWQRVGRKLIKGNSTRFAPGTGPPVPQRCPETGGGFTMGGPYWAEPLHDPEWVQGVLGVLRAQRPQFAAFDRIQGLLTNIADELPDCPLYFDLHSVCKTLRCSAPRHEILRSALLNAGFRVSGTHCTPLGIKTDAPWEAIWDIMRCWVADHPIKTPAADSPAGVLLSKQPTLKADFSRAQAAVQRRGKGKVARFLPNPEPNWGPKPKHGRGINKRQEAAAAAAAAAAVQAEGEAQEQQEGEAQAMQEDAAPVEEQQQGDAALEPQHVQQEEEAPTDAAAAAPEAAT